MKTAISMILLGVLAGASASGEDARHARTDTPRVAASAIVAWEHRGLVIVEAEDFFKQTNAEIRAWHITDATAQPNVGRDIDPPNFATASRGASIEVLPDEGNDGTPPVRGLSISDQPGEMAVVYYRVHFSNPGRYYIWSRAFGTDGDDNTLHYGIDGTWPESSARSHTFGGKRWQWANRHRQHKGKIYFDVGVPGVRTIAVSMREDGCELDQFLLTTEEDWSPPDHHGPLDPPLPTERDGVLIVEAEDLLPSQGWEERSALDGSTGRGYIAWTLPRQGRPPGEGVLRLRFRIATAGDYRFLWRSRLSDPSNRPETRDPDGNDTWLRILTGSDVPDHQPLGLDWRKVALFDHPESWSWSTHLDNGPPHPDNPPVRHFEAGVHLLELSGRSQGHLIDRLVLLHIERGADLRRTPVNEEHLTAMPPSPIY